MSVRISIFFFNVLDYDCVGIDAWTGRYVCPEYKAPT